MMENSDILKIASALFQYNVYDKPYNKTGEEYLMVGKEDGRIAVVDEEGELHEIANPVFVSRSGDSGEIRLTFGITVVVLKWGRINIDTGGSSQTETTYTGTFPEPFPNNCSVMNLTQRINDPVTSIMVNPNKEGYTIKVGGGINNEEFSYFAIGY